MFNRLGKFITPSDTKDILHTKKNIVVLGFTGYFILLILAWLYSHQFDLSIVFLISAFPFALLSISHLKIQTRAMLWLSAAYQVLPAILASIFAYLKDI
ncbi:MAG: hypothetical protein ACTH5W_20255 [Providencia sp.]|uniref:hypothetical protein n=1 Tax=Providencia sp. TaxID=589 RepID=UPI003F9E509C